MAKAKRTKGSRLGRYYSSYNFLGVIVGSLFLFGGTLPTLLPRGWILQGVLSGVLFAIGYGIGLVISHVIRSLRSKELPASDKQRYKKYTYIVLAVLYAVSLVIGFQWQQEV